MVWSVGVWISTLIGWLYIYIYIWIDGCIKIYTLYVGLLVRIINKCSNLWIKEFYCDLLKILRYNKYKCKQNIDGWRMRRERVYLNNPIIIFSFHLVQNKCLICRLIQYFKWLSCLHLIQNGHSNWSRLQLIEFIFSIKFYVFIVIIITSNILTQTKHAQQHDFWTHAHVPIKEHRLAGGLNWINNY